MAHGTNGFHHGNIASSSSNPYPDLSNVNLPIFSNQSLPGHHQRHHHPPQAQPMHHGQWNPPIRQASMSQAHLPTAPQNHPYNQQQAWSNVNHMHPQQFPNPMSVMSAFNVPFFPQQVMQDAFLMTPPVESADEKILLQTLLDSRRRVQSYKDALNTLHGRNGHSASQWKDYYLDHKDRLDETISLFLNPPHIALQVEPRRPSQKSSPSSFKTEPSPARSLPKRPTPSEHSIVRPPQPASNAGKRNTINSLTTPAPVFGDRLPAPNAEIQIPDPPSRSPTPPTIVIPHRGRGNKYTPEDREFFLKFIAWRLKGDPSLTRNDLCALLAEKAPHHTSQSWASYWSNRHDVPDKILAAAKGDEYDLNESESEEEKITIRRRPKYKDSSSEGEDGDGGTGHGDAEPGENDDEPINILPENEMGPKGGPFTDADLYITAKYMASFPSFEEASGKERWQPFSERYPQRSTKSWAEYYRRNEDGLLKMARKIKKQDHNISSSIQRQRTRPSRASVDLSGLHHVKRKYSMDLDADGDDDDECPPSRNKRGRGAE